MSRLVWAPETKAAFFGGDRRQFRVPRFCLDVALFRVYEDGKAAKIEHFLKYSENGRPKAKLVFVSGNPGRTQRIFTLDALKYLRDQRLPRTLTISSARDSAAAVRLRRQGSSCVVRGTSSSGSKNSRKAYTGMLQGLQTPSFLEQKGKAKPNF